MLSRSCIHPSAAAGCSIRSGARSQRRSFQIFAHPPQLPPSDVRLEVAAIQERSISGRRSILLSSLAGVAAQLVGSRVAKAAAESPSGTSPLSSNTVPAAPSPAQPSSASPPSANAPSQPSGPSTTPPAQPAAPGLGASNSNSDGKSVSNLQQPNNRSSGARTSPSASPSAASASGSTQVPVPPPAVPLAEYPSPLKQPSSSPPSTVSVPMDNLALSDEAARQLLKEEESRRKQRKGKGRLRELEEIRYELAEKEIALLRKETQLLEKDQTLLVMTEELELERKLRALLTKEKDRAEEEAALAMGLCTGGAMLP